MSVIFRPDNGGPTFYADVATSLGAPPSGFSWYATDLNALGSARLNGVLPLLPSGPTSVQFICSYVGDTMGRMKGTLSEAICAGLATYSADYFEVYKADLTSDDPEVVGAIAALHDSSLCPCAISSGCQRLSLRLPG